MTNAMVCDEIPTKSGVVRASLPLILRNGGTTQNLSFPLFSKGFPTCAFAKEWGARCARGAPLDATGFSVKLFLPELLVFS